MSLIIYLLVWLWTGCYQHCSWPVAQRSELLCVDTCSELSFNLYGPSEHFLKLSVKFDEFLPRDAMLSAVYAVVVCLCVTLQYCIKTAKRRIMQIMLHDNPMTLVFWCQRSWRNSNGITPYGNDKCKWDGLKLATFDGKRESLPTFRCHLTTFYFWSAYPLSAVHLA